MPTEAPAAPAAAPAAVTPPTEKAPADFMADAVADFAEMDAAPPPAPAPAKPKAKPEKPAAETKPAKDEIKPPADATKSPEGATKPAEDEPVRPVKAAELRTAYEGLKKKVSEYEPEIQRLRAKVEELEKGGGEEAKTLTERYNTAAKRADELEKKIAYLDYLESSEYQTKYEQPYSQAWADAVAEFGELSVKEHTGDDEAGDPIYTLRPATEKDLVKLGSMPLSEMDEAVQKMFGASAPRAVSHITELRKLARARYQAQQEAKTRAVEYKTRQRDQMKAQGEQLSEAWKEVNKSLETRFPKAFKPEEGDDADKAGHNKGFALANLLFVGEEGLTPEQVEALPEPFKEAVKSKQPLTDKMRVQLHALARLKMANHDRQLVRIHQMRERIAELEKSLSQYEASEPGAGKPKDGAPPAHKDWLEEAEAELQQLDRKG